MAKNNNTLEKDYKLFERIQVKKYLESKNKMDFSTDFEETVILERIGNYFEDCIISEKLKLLNLNKKAKEEWFKSIDIDYSDLEEDFDEYLDDDEYEVDEIDDDEDYDDEEFWDAVDVDEWLDGLIKKENLYDEEEIADLYVLSPEEYDELFSFLPKGAWEVFMFCIPLFEAYGFPFKRLKEIFSGASLTNFEVEFFKWAHDFLLSVISILIEKNDKKRKKLLDKAIDTGLYFLTLEQTFGLMRVLSIMLADIYIETKNEGKNNKKK